jgi:glycosyltransferase involved in cell wall biosynthesis
VNILPMRTGLPLITSLEYCGRLLLKEHKSLLIAYNEPTLAGLAPCRSIIRFDFNTPLPRYWKLPGWLSRFQRGRYLFPSESERQLFLGQHPLIPPGSALVIPNGVDLNLFRPAERGDVGPRVGFGGQWHPRKGLAPLLEAWTMVRKRLPAAELCLAGGAGLWKDVSASPQAQAPARRVEAMAQEGALRIVGEQKRSEMPAFWNSVSVAVVPSLYEPFGLVALEALACGVPVVASAVGGLPEFVVNGECGFLVPPNDPSRLAAALVDLLNNPELRQKMAAAARRQAQGFSLKRRSEALLALVASRAGMNRGAPAA